MTSRRRRRAASVVVISWRNIPAQVVGTEGHKQEVEVLSERFQHAIDRAAATGARARQLPWTLDIKAPSSGPAASRAPACSRTRPIPRSTGWRRRSASRSRRGAAAPLATTPPPPSLPSTPSTSTSTSLLPPRLCASCTPGNKLLLTRTPPTCRFPKTTKSAGKTPAELSISVARSLVRGRNPLA